MNLLNDLGNGAKELIDRTMRDLRLQHVELDEQWAFCEIKQGHIPDNRISDTTIGDQYIFLAQDHDSRLIVSHLVGKRDGANTRRFVADLAERLHWPEETAVSPFFDYRQPVVQISSDAWEPYREAISSSFGGRVRYGQIVKDTAAMERDPNHWAQRRAIEGDVNLQSISTAYIERQNLTNRVFMRRLTRKGLCFSKKLANLKSAVSLHVAYWNFCWASKWFNYETPAQKARLESRRWSIADLYARISN